MCIRDSDRPRSNSLANNEFVNKSDELEKKISLNLESTAKVLLKTPVRIKSYKNIQIYFFCSIVLLIVSHLYVWKYVSKYCQPLQICVMCKEVTLLG